MQRFISLWAKLVVRGRWWVIALAVIGFGLAFLPMGKLYYDNANERFFVEGDPNLVAFNQLLDLFGDIEYLSVGLEASGTDDVFSATNLAVIQDITEFLEDQPQVTQVRSLTKYEYTHSDGAMMATDELLEDISDEYYRDQGRKLIGEQPMALGSLITEDLKHTRVVARVRYQVGSSDNKITLMTNLRQFLADQRYIENGINLRLSGQPVFNEQFEVLTKRDQSWINPTMAVVMIIILFISFRSWLAMLLPWVVIGTSIVYVTGIQGLMVWPHSVVESALVPALIIIGIGISVHVLVEFYHGRSDGLAPREASEQTIRTLWVPAFYTALTTAAGFLALSVTELLPVKQFAWLGAIGAMMLFFVSFTLLPAVLSFVKPFSIKTDRAVSSGFVARLTQKLPEFTQHYRKPLLGFGLILLLGSIALVPQLNIDSNFITYFKQDNTTRQDLEYFDQTYNGIQNIDVIIDSGSEGGIHEPAFLREVDALQTWLESLPETGAVNSLVDFHREINQALHFDDPEWYQLPTDRQMAAQFLLLYDNTGAEEDLTDAKDFYERYLRLSVPIKNLDASDTRALLGGIENHLAEQHPGLNVQLTGSLVMYNAQDIYINEGMTKSFSVALVIIGLSFIVLFRSVKYGLIALIPSVVPILITGALLVVLGIPLNLGTMIVGAMTMGIAVDDAIHVMNRYLTARRSGLNTREALKKTMNQAGRAVIFTSIVLVCGFSVMLLGSFIPYIYTGLFAATIMALALLGDLLFLPALLFVIDRKSDAKLAAKTNLQEELSK
ncbi:efflux RND transporter permease subunit [Gilvimarinus sp. SDUM040013]|uniref:Efflux RND transporter permease subunit n=1 Tax=Gilvimarinus gilvus TaxID=3058038 RepID=A0ABU4RZY1_9GAMM|nr:efflux RND transporter permease subunit [Gilvimarinus sp. SDUM040013]MDO3386582.1 efflux RND transporter permease subunit [Gilvimarinus sp. SDUM040013]MDX6849158.1 efflux RND transporter permease subunit [Gilvimarinus sp. SDUM040013]